MPSHRGHSRSAAARARSGRHELAGAYALDALDEAERGRFDRHLRRCPACTAEVRQFQEVATELALAAAAEPPPGLRDRVMAAAARTAQVPADVPSRRRPEGWRPRVADRAVSGQAVGGPPAGLLPAAVAGRTAPVLASGLLTGDKLGLTVEPAGGSSRPTTPPVLLLSLGGTA